MALNALAAVFIAVGFLAGLTGMGLMYYSVEDEQRNDGWFFHDAERTDENVARHNAGRILAVLGTIVLVAGVFVAATAEGSRPE